MKGRLYGVGVGPGDPELITLKAAKLIKRADVVAYHSGTAGRSIARSIVADLISEDATEELLIYPVTTGDANHPLGYYGVIADFYDESAERLGKHLDAGSTVVVLAEGDPLFYSSYMYLHDRLAGQFRCEVVPGVTSMTAAAAAAGIPLARHEDVLTVLPGTLPMPELARRLTDTDAAVIMKLGRTFDGVREALRQAGRLESARYVERATTGGEQTRPVAEVDPRSVPYFSMIVVPGADRRQDSAGRHAHRALPEPDERQTRPDPIPGGTSPEPVEGPQLFVVGLGPGAMEWLTPEVSAALAEVDHVVGYGPYVDRVPPRPRPSAARQRKYRRAGSGPIRSRSRPQRRAGGCGLRGRPGDLRHGVGGVRGGGRRPLREDPNHCAAGGDSGAGGGGPGGCSTGWRLRRDISVRPPQALAGDRGAAAGRCRRRSRPGHLQPGVTKSA